MQDLCQRLHYAGHMAGTCLLDLLKLAKSLACQLCKSRGAPPEAFLSSLWAKLSPGAASWGVGGCSCAGLYQSLLFAFSDVSKVS